jgi:hypothetical protein
VARGGARSGAGRKKGRKNARTVEREQHMHQAAQLIEQALGDTAFAGDAHDLLMAVYKDTSHRIELRIDAAKAAIGYEKPRLGTTTLQGDEDAPLHVVGELVWASSASE